MQNYTVKIYEQDTLKHTLNFTNAPFFAVLEETENFFGNKLTWSTAKDSLVARHGEHYIYVTRNYG